MKHLSITPQPDELTRIFARECNDARWSRKHILKGDGTVESRIVSSAAIFAVTIVVGHNDALSYLLAMDKGLQLSGATRARGTSHRQYANR